MAKPFAGVITHWRFNVQDRRINGVCLFYNGTSSTVQEGAPITTSEVVEITMVKVSPTGHPYLMAVTQNSRYLLVD